MELSIWISSYNDLYSDFDSRNFSKRLVSEDFIHELKRNAKEVRGEIKRLWLHLPEQSRVPQIETEITGSLKSFLSNQYQVTKDEISQLRKKGVLMSLLGFLLLIAAAAVHYADDGSFLFSALRVIIEPAGWFLSWNGFDTLLYDVRSKRIPFIIFEKLKQSDIIFVNEEAK